jgi:hypothetical protein
MNEQTLAAATHQIHAIPDISSERAASASTDLLNLSAASGKLVDRWIKTGSIPAFELKGLSLREVVDTLGIHPLLAIIMLDKLSKDSKAFSLIVREQGGRLRFVSRDVPARHLPHPVASELTRTVAQAAAEYFRESHTDPEELKLSSPLPQRLWPTTASPARSTSREALKASGEKLRKVVARAEEVEAAGAGEAGAGEAGAGGLSEVGRIALVLRTIERLVADDLRRLGNGDDSPAG